MFYVCNNSSIKYGEISNNPERVSKLRPFIDDYNWKHIEFPSGPKDWKKLEQNNKTIALNILYVPYNTKQIRSAHTSKYNSKRDNQIILLIINDNKKKYHLAVKNIYPDY